MYRIVIHGLAIETEVPEEVVRLARAASKSLTSIEPTVHADHPPPWEAFMHEVTAEHRREQRRLLLALKSQPNGIRRAELLRALSYDSGTTLGGVLASVIRACTRVRLDPALVVEHGHGTYAPGPLLVEKDLPFASSVMNDPGVADAP